MKIGIAGTRLKDLGDRGPEVAEWLTEQLNIIYKLIDKEEPLDCYTGMNNGVDQIFGHCVLQTRNNLHCIFAYHKKPNDNINFLTKFATSIIYISNKYEQGCYKKRDKLLIEAIDVLLVVWDGERSGGVWNMMRLAYAAKVPMKVYRLNRKEEAGTRWVRCPLTGSRKINA